MVRLSGVRELVNLLSTYDTPDARAWQLRLLAFLKKGYTAAKRYDGVAYAVGNRPKTRTSWIPFAAPHSGYTGKRSLEAMEFQFENVDQLVDILYRGK